MIDNKPIRGLCFVCDHEGHIRKVLRNDISVFDGTNLPASFFSLFDATGKQKAMEFWDLLGRESTIFDWELNAIFEGATEVYKFSGMVTNNELFLSALKKDDVLEFVLEELMIMNNEQQNLLRHSEKSLSAIKNQHKGPHIDVLNEMTALNNEMMNQQRTLLKQNAEISRLNASLRNINHDLEQFTYVASHDLKEPLRMVTSFMSLLKTRYGHQLDEKAHSYINFAIDGGKRMQKMVSDLLDLSRTGHQQDDKKLININEIVIDVSKNIHKLIEENKAEIIINKELPVVNFSKADITRLLQNLISNAIKFRKKDIIPVIRLYAVEKNDAWLFCIEDNGIGIAPEKFKNIFEIFTRLNSPESYEGSGIGLAICKKIVERNGGEIWVTSEEGAGCTFYFTILKNNKL